MPCDLAFTACMNCMVIDFFRRSGREITQDESGVWWDGPHRLGRCLDEIRDQKINNETKGEAA